MELSQKTVGKIVSGMCEDYGWDCAAEYGEPGYGGFIQDTFAVVLGDYWLRDADGNLTSRFDKWPRLTRALEEAGVHFEWYDEWVVDYERSKAYRCQPDSYSWLPSIVFTEHGELLTPDDDMETWVDWAKNDTGRCLLGHLHSEDDLVGIGFRSWPDDDNYYESGWHPGQDDDPKKITEDIRRQLGDVDIVFITTSKGQFDSRFVAMIREEVNI